MTGMVMVKKRDGRKEPFIPEKIIVSAIKSGSSPDYARTIAQDIEKSTKDGATTQEIKVKVLSMLKSKNPEWERNWMVYDTAVKKGQIKAKNNADLSSSKFSDVIKKDGDVNNGYFKRQNFLAYKGSFR